MTTHLSSAVAEDQSLLICQMYPGVYTQVMSDRAPAAVKPALRRRRRKRKREGGAKKRNLSVEQVRQLELSFEHQHKLETERKDRLAAEVGLDPRQVAVWFQNRRARWKAKRTEEEYSKLKAVLDTQAIENRRLEAEVTKLKQQLSEAERRLSEQSAVDAGVPCKSCLSAASLSIQSMEAQLLGGLRMDGLESIFYAPPAPAESYYVQDMDWVDLQGV